MDALAQRLSEAWAKRRPLLETGDAFRWLDGEHRGTTVDLYADVAVLSLYTQATPAQELAWAQALMAVRPLRAVALKRRPAEAHRTANDAAAEVAPLSPLAGEPVDVVVATELGVKFEIRPFNGLSVGLYLDAREVRARVRALARGRRVLNLFSYTCGFGVAAMLGGAREVVNVDRSRRVLDWGEANYALNGLAVGEGGFLSGDAFEWLKRLGKKPGTFDLVIVDPPSFATGKEGRFSVEKDYGRLLRQVFPLLAPKATVLACCNLDRWSLAVFERTVTPVLPPGARVLARSGPPALDFDEVPGRLKVLELSLP